MSNKKPSKDLVVSIMAQTYKGRRKFIYQAKAVAQVLQTFPGYVIMAVVSVSV